MASRLNKQALFEDVGYEPHEGQRAIHASKASRRCVACGVRWGKTKAAAMEALAALLEPRERGMGWICAPTYDLSERVFNEVAMTAMQHLRHRVVTWKEHERRLVMRNLGGGISEVRGKSADNPVSLLGEGLDFLIIDEASRLRPAVWQNHLSQRLIDRRGWALLISTPRGKGWFYDLWQRGRGRDPEYASWNMPSWENPLLDAELIEAERGRLPERVFRQEYGAEFLEGSGAVFRGIRERALLDWQAPVAGERYYVGIDLAKVEDFTVIVVLNRKREVVYVDRFHRLPWSVMVDRIRVVYDRFSKPLMLVDSTGKGEPIYESIRAAGCNNVEGYTFTSKSKNDLINNLSLLFEQGQITLPKAELWPDGIDELEAFEYDVLESGTVKTGAPSGIHDDCVIALALAAWHSKHAAAAPDYRVLGGSSGTWRPSRGFSRRRR